MNLTNKKIFMLAPTPFFADRGGHIRVLNSYLHLKRKKNKLVLFTYPIGRDIKGINVIRVIKIPGYKKLSPGFSWYKPLVDVILLILVLKAIKKERPDLIYAHLHEGAFLASILQTITNIPYIYDAQGSVIGELEAHNTVKKTSRVNSLIEKVESWYVKRADQIITSTDNLAIFFQQKYFLTQKPTVIKDLPDKELFNSKVKTKKLDLPQGKIIVGYLGGLQPYKGINYLLQAIQLCPNRFHFLIMGYPVDYVSKQIYQLKITNRVTLTGKVPYEEAASYLKNVHIAISPKTLESGEANAKLYIYQAMNIPIVCFDFKENRAVLGSQGYYADEISPSGIARAIQSIT